MSELVAENAKPWYREFWFWFVFSPLIYIIIMCSITVTIALKGADDVIIDNYYKEGRMINQALEQDQRARDLGLLADLRFDRTSGDVMISLTSAVGDTASLPDTILLMMGHPVKEEKDQIIHLKAIAPGQYRGTLATEPQYSWYLTLYPIGDIALRKEAPWTLSGEIDFRISDKTGLAPRVK
jgi:hypothetical protein